MNTVAVIITIVLILVGIAGTFVPILPGIPLIFVAIAAYGWYDGFQVITASYLAVLAGLALLSLFVDYLATYLGAKHFDSSKVGMWGAVLGGVAGIFIIPPLGLLICPWLGAILGELLQGHDLKKALRSGFGAVIGLFSGIVVKVIVGVAMLVSFLVILI